jgi:hypothetical protein
MAMFTVSVFTPAGDGSVDAADLVTYAAMELFAGGTESYSITELNLVLDAIKELYYNFIFFDDYGTDVDSANNLAIQYHIEAEAKHGHIGVVAAEDEEANYADSLAACATYNSEQVVVVHGAMLKANNKAPTGFDQFSAMYKAAYFLGRTAGLPPQVPPTFKELAIDGEVHKLKFEEKKDALNAGLLVTVDDEEFDGRVVLQGVNSLQENEYMINGDAKSHVIQIVRIKHQLNYDIYYNAKKTLFGDPKGVNRNTLSQADVKTWLEGFLKTKIANKDEDGDNLIVAFQNVTVERKGDIYYAQYEFEPNGEINKMLITGVIID